MTGDELRDRYESWESSPNQDPSFRHARAEAYVAGYVARAAEQAKDEVALLAIQQTLRFLRGQPCMADAVRSELSGIRHVLDQEYPSKPEPQQPSTRELIATVRQGIGNMQHDAWSKADLALTELEKRIGGE